MITCVLCHKRENGKKERNYGPGREIFSRCNERGKREKMIRSIRTTASSRLLCKLCFVGVLLYNLYVCVVIHGVKLHRMFADKCTRYTRKSAIRVNRWQRRIAFIFDYIAKNISAPNPKRHSLPRVTRLLCVLPFLNIRHSVTISG